MRRLRTSSFPIGPNVHAAAARFPLPGHRESYSGPSRHPRDTSSGPSRTVSSEQLLSPPLSSPSETSHHSPGPASSPHPLTIHSSDDAEPVPAAEHHATRPSTVSCTNGMDPYRTPPFVAATASPPDVLPLSPQATLHPLYPSPLVQQSQDHTHRASPRCVSQRRGWTAPRYSDGDSDTECGGHGTQRSSQRARGTAGSSRADDAGTRSFGYSQRVMTPLERCAEDDSTRSAEVSPWVRDALLTLPLSAGMSQNRAAFDDNVTSPTESSVHDDERLRTTTTTGGTSCEAVYCPDPFRLPSPGQHIEEEDAFEEDTEPGSPPIASLERNDNNRRSPSKQDEGSPLRQASSNVAPPLAERVAARRTGRTALHELLRGQLQRGLGITTECPSPAPRTRSRPHTSSSSSSTASLLPPRSQYMGPLSSWMAQGSPLCDPRRHEGTAPAPYPSRAKRQTTTTSSRKPKRQHAHLLQFFQ